MEAPSALHPDELSIPTVDGHRLAAARHGGDARASSPGVLLLHGLSQQGRFWDPVVRRLRARPVLALDQRGHGASDVPLGADFSIRACAADAVSAMDIAGLERPVLVGHSWGAAVALECAVRHPDRVASIALVDGGAWSMPAHVDRAAARERLRPPALGMPAEELWSMIAADAPWFDEETRAALTPTFREDPAGGMRTRIGVDRHMAVLDGILDYDVAEAWRSLAVPAWVVSCEPHGEPRDLRLVVGGPDRRILRWEGAVHDVPLQWPSLVAGLIDQACEGAAS